MDYQTALERLRKRNHVPLFASEPWDAELGEALREARPESFFAAPVRDASMAACAVAGLHLWNDEFDAAHELCQGIQSATGSYWHGLCHRREGHRGSGLAANLGNTRYWFRRVGSHPAYTPVYHSALTLLDNTGAGFRWATEAAGALRQAGEWDPALMIDWIAQADAGTLSAATTAVLEEIQWREIDLLVDWCARAGLDG